MPSALAMLRVGEAAQPLDQSAHLFHFSLRSRCTAMLAGLRTLIQTAHGPDQ
jgi:hypothetical protein